MMIFYYEKTKIINVRVYDMENNFPDTLSGNCVLIESCPIT